MKKIISLAIISTVLALPTLASAAGELPGPWKNKGQCESALKTVRNDIRAAVKDVVPPSDVNQIFRENLACAQNTDGTWSIVVL